MKCFFCKTAFIILSLLWPVVLSGKVFYIGQSTQQVYKASDFAPGISGGDTIKIQASRRNRLQFKELSGSTDKPIVFINSGGLVEIKGYEMPAIMFENCHHVKLTGKGSPAHRFGFRLSGPSFGVSFEQYSSHGEVEYIQIDSCSLGVHAKKDFGSHPPFPYPVFSHLAIHDNFLNYCIEAMYIGETKSPGMELKHLRIYNNVITHSGRECIQIANSVDDIEVYNNFCYDSGLENSIGQLNNSQLGGNSIGRFYNNIFVQAPSCGVAIFGKGDMYIYNNYFQDNTGIFSDDRYWPVEGAPLRVEGNYFRNITGNQIMTLSNLHFNIFVNNNKYNTNIKFLNRSDAYPIQEKNGNILTTVSPLNYQISNGVFYPSASNPPEYAQMGPIPGLTHTYNYTPVFDSIPDQYIEIGQVKEISIRATTEDNDSIRFSTENLPPFAKLTTLANGIATLVIDARNQSKGLYYPRLSATDKSHNGISRLSFKIAIKTATNRSTQLSLPDTLHVEAATKFSTDVSAIDSDNDDIIYTITGKPEFADFKPTTSKAFLHIRPSFIDAGTYPIVIRAEDGYSNPATDTLILVVDKPALYPNRVIYRVNYGGGEIQDSPINWQRDAGNSTSYEANYSMGTGSGQWTGVNTTGAPDSIFGPFRYNGVNQTDMLFSYPCPPGKYRVNLYFVQRGTEIINNTAELFSIFVENELKEDSVDLYKQAGYNAIKKSYILDIRDASIEVKLRKIRNNSKLNGVEITYLEAINMPPVILSKDTLTAYTDEDNSLAINYSDDHIAGCNSLSAGIVSGPQFAQVQFENGNLKVNCKPTSSDTGFYDLLIKVSDGCLQSEQKLVLKVMVRHTHPPVGQIVSLHPVPEGSKDTIQIKFTDGDGDNMRLSAENLPLFATFSDKGKGIGWLIVSPDYLSSDQYKINIIATDDYSLRGNISVNLTVSDAMPIQRIALSPAQITDLVTGGSSNPPSLVADEQNLDPLKNEHPISKNWKPYYNDTKAPHHFVVDLGQLYTIRKIWIHDMNNIGQLNFYTGKPDDWKDLFSCQTSSYNAWTPFSVETTTRYLRVSELNTVIAEFNELAVYGHAVNTAPVRVNISDSLFRSGIKDTLFITYNDPESQSIQIEAQNLPGFAQFEDLKNGKARITILASDNQAGRYSVKLNVSDNQLYTLHDTISFRIAGPSGITKPKADNLFSVRFDRKNKLLVICETQNEPILVEINSINGHLLLKSCLKTISLSHFDKGTYILSVYNATKSRKQIIKLII